LAANNLRDLPQDALAGKKTMAVKIGDKNTRRFFVLLIVIAQIFALGASAITQLAFICALCLPLTYLISREVLTGAAGKELISVLTRTAKLQLLMAVLLTTALII
jgi:1,4-dihydroxy-2-naphthoate octaprenyltransferase